MDIYRFRSWSELTIKEILYSEIFFASTDECNDPCDGKPFHTFLPNRSYWLNIIQKHSSRGPYVLDNTHVDSILNILMRHCPVTFDDFIEKIPGILRNEFSSHPDSNLFNQAIDHIVEYCNIYAPQTDYFASFTIDKNEPLMWSHYSSQHEGLCLIFRIEQNKFPQHPLLRKRHIKIDTRNGIAANMSHGINDDFHFSEISYNNSFEQLNAFYCFPHDVCENPTAEELDQYRSGLTKQEYTKHSSWAYEKEYRISLPAPISGLFGKRVSLSKQNRLFHYHPDWLVGVIFGARMNHERKSRLKDMLLERDEMTHSLSLPNRRLSSIAFFESKLSMLTKGIDILPADILNNGKIYTNSDRDFDTLWADWNSQTVIEVSGNSGSKRKLLS